MGIAGPQRPLSIRRYPSQHKDTSLLIQASIEVLLRYLLVRASPMTHAFKFLLGNEHRHRHVCDKK
jgi:hypothetical protein